MRMPDDIEAFKLTLLPVSLQEVDADKFRINRLGLYYEDIVNLFVTKNFEFIDIKRNVQVNANKRTLGEFDFIFRDSTGQTVHLECAIKFYLCDGSPSSLGSFVGPNRIDRLEKKWSSLINKQSKLADLSESNDVLRALGFESVSCRAVLMQGMLFYPFNNSNTLLHPEINPSHAKGWWIRQSECGELMEHSDIRIHHLEKPHWFAVRGPQLFVGQLAEIKQPIFCARFDGGIELDRGFIVPDRWGLDD